MKAIINFILNLWEKLFGKKKRIEKEAKDYQEIVENGYNIEVFKTGNDNNNFWITFNLNRGKEFKFRYSNKWNGFDLGVDDKRLFIFNQIELFEMMRSWHFDLDNLIVSNLAIDINTLKQ